MEQGVHISNKASDWRFVRDVLAARGLQARPLAGFHIHTDYWAEDDTLLRVVERYSWGCVVVLKDKAAPEAPEATLVIEGEFDPESGLVVTDSEMIIEVAKKLPWYRGLAARAIGRQAVPGQKVPGCLGSYVPQPVCDGGFNGTTYAVEAVCGWRDLCMALRDHCEAVTTTPEEMLKGMEPAEIIQTVRALGRLAAPPQKALEDPEGLIEQRNVAPVKRPHPGPSPKIASREFVTALVTDFWLALDKALKPQHRLRGVPKLWVKPPKGQPRPGDVVVVDRMSAGNYYYLYCEVPKLPKITYNRITVAVVRPRPNLREVQVALLMPVEEAQKGLGPLPEEADLFKIGSIKDGRFKTLLRGIKTKDGIDRAVELIRSVVMRQAWREIDRRRRRSRDAVAAAKSKAKAKAKGKGKRPVPPPADLSKDKKW